MRTSFWLLMGYNFGCVMASDTLFNSMGGFSVSSYPMKTADFEVIRDIAMATIFLAFYVYGAHWRHLANTTGPSICGSDATLCQTTFTTCYSRPVFAFLTSF